MVDSEMKKGFTLIELIFSMVIIALVFTVVPKIIYAFNKSDIFSMREDAIMNGVSLTNMISRLPWDENNTEHNDILKTNSSEHKFDCNATTHYRVGGFIGSRNCEDDQNFSASNISNDGESDPSYFNDFDDFNDINISAKLNGEDEYNLSNQVSYVDDNGSIFDFDYTHQRVTISLQNVKNSTVSTNLKELNLIVFYVGKRGKARELANFYYISPNIGQFYIKKRSW